MTFVYKHRGKVAVRAQEFECPEHGRFEMDAPPDVDFVACPFEVEDPTGAPAKCPHNAEWRISKSGVAKMKTSAAVRGKSQKPEHPGWLDTRELGEGMPLEEWREKRRQIREQQRKADVMKFKREEC